MSEIQRFLWEADQFTYEPRGSGPREHGAELLAPLGEYVRIEDYQAEVEKREEVEGALKKRADECEQFCSYFDKGASFGYRQALQLLRGDGVGAGTRSAGDSSPACGSSLAKKASVDSATVEQGGDAVERDRLGQGGTRRSHVAGAGAVEEDGPGPSAQHVSLVGQAQPGVSIEGDPGPEQWCGECGLRLTADTPPSVWTGHVHKPVAPEVMHAAWTILALVQVAGETDPESLSRARMKLDRMIAAAGLTEEAIRMYGRLSTQQQLEQSTTGKEDCER